MRPEVIDALAELMYGGDANVSRFVWDGASDGSAQVQLCIDIDADTMRELRRRQPVRSDDET